MKHASLEKTHAPTFVHQFHWGPSLAILFLLAVMIASEVTHSIVSYYQSTTDNQHFLVQSNLDILLRAMLDQETGVRGYIATADPIFLEPFYRGQRAYSSTLPRLQAQLQEYQFYHAQLQLTHVQASVAQWSNAFAIQQFQMIRAGNLKQPRQTSTALKGKRLFDHFRHAITQLQSAINQDFAEITTQLNHLSLSIQIGTVLSSILAIFLLWWTLNQNYRKLSSQLILISNRIHQMKAGERSVRIPTLQHAELQVIGQSINDMVNSMQQQQAEIAQSEHNFRLLADAMPQIVWTSNPDGWLDYYNQKWFDYTGMSLEQTQGWGWGPVLHPDDLQHCIDVWAHSVKTAEPYQIEYRFKRASDGTYRWHLGRALPVTDANGTVIKWFGTGTDIHDWKVAEEKLADLLLAEEQARKEAEQAGMQLLQINHAQRNFFAVVSHEFRTTLTSIQGFSALLRDEEFNPSEIKEYAADIHTDALRLHRMIDSLLDLEKMQSGKMQLFPEPVDLQALLQQAVTRIRQVAAHYTISLQIDDQLPFIEADRDKIIQVITNLLSNAVKYSPQGGDILVHSTLEEPYVHVYVQDHGVGIPSEQIEQIFIPYSRVHSAATQYIQGTGLGLPIVRQIVEMHNGKVWVESVPDHGSCFHFMLPLHLPNNATITNDIQLIPEQTTATRKQR